MKLVESINLFGTEATARLEFWQHSRKGNIVDLSLKERVKAFAFGVFLILGLVFQDVRQACLECWKQFVLGKKFKQAAQIVSVKEGASIAIQTEPVKVKPLEGFLDKSLNRFSFGDSEEDVSTIVSDDITSDSEDDPIEEVSSHGESMDVRDHAIDIVEEPELDRPEEIELWQRFKAAYFGEIKRFKSLRKGYFFSPNLQAHVTQQVEIRGYSIL